MGDCNLELLRFKDRRPWQIHRVASENKEFRILCLPNPNTWNAKMYRLESADMKSKAGRGKVLGTMVCVGGAMLLTFYKGMALTNTSHSQAMAYTSQTSSPDSHEKAHKWTIGSIMLLGACLCWSSWFLIQAKIGKAFPAPYSSTTVISFLSCLQSATLSLAIKRDISLWALKGKFRIATVIYAVSIAQKSL